MRKKHSKQNYFSILLLRGNDKKETKSKTKLKRKEEEKTTTIHLRST
jgi:hypothetical protein